MTDTCRSTERASDHDRETEDHQVADETSGEWLKQLLLVGSSSDLEY